jgi:hypothetical protein
MFGELEDVRSWKQMLYWRRCLASYCSLLILSRDSGSAFAFGSPFEDPQFRVSHFAFRTPCFPRYCTSIHTRAIRLSITKAGTRSVLFVAHSWFLRQHAYDNRMSALSVQITRMSPAALG